MALEVTIEHRDSLPLAVIRRRVLPHQLSRVVPEGCGRVWSLLKQHGVTGSGRHVAVYLNGDIDLEVGVEISGTFTGAAEVVPSATPAGLVAAVTHLGPYQELPRAHQTVRQFCSDHCHALAGPSWEIYGHWEQAWEKDPGRIRTDVYYQLTADG